LTIVGLTKAKGPALLQRRGEILDYTPQARLPEIQKSQHFQRPGTMLGLSAVSSGVIRNGSERRVRAQYCRWCISQNLAERAVC